MGGAKKHDVRMLPEDEDAKTRCVLLKDRSSDSSYAVMVRSRLRKSMVEKLRKALTELAS